MIKTLWKTVKWDFPKNMYIVYFSCKLTRPNLVIITQLWWIWTLFIIISLFRAEKVLKLLKKDQNDFFSHNIYIVCFMLPMRLNILNLAILTPLCWIFIFQSWKSAKTTQKGPKWLFFSQYVHSLFHVAQEAYYTEFGDPNSIMLDFHFSELKKC